MVKATFILRALARPNRKIAGPLHRQQSSELSKAVRAQDNIAMKGNGRGTQMASQEGRALVRRDAQVLSLSYLVCLG